MEKGAASRRGRDESWRGKDESWCGREAPVRTLLRRGGVCREWEGLPVELRVEFSREGVSFGLDASPVALHNHSRGQ